MLMNKKKVALSTDGKQKIKPKRDYVLHEPPLRYLLNTWNNFTFNMNDKKYDKFEEIISKKMNEAREKAKAAKKPDPFEEPKPEIFVRPKSKVEADRNYKLHESRFLNLQENYFTFHKFPKQDRPQSKEDRIRKKRLSGQIKNKKSDILNARKNKVEELRTILEELEEEDEENMTKADKEKKKLRIATLKARIEREKSKLKDGLLPQPSIRPKFSTPESILEWSNPPVYDQSAPPLRRIQDIQENYTPYMDPVRQKNVYRVLENVQSKQQEYMAWQSKIKKDFEENLTREGIQPIKLRLKIPPIESKTSQLPHVERVYGEKPEYKLYAPPFRYVADVEENFLHLREETAKELFCKRFLKAREIELRKQKKRDERIKKIEKFYMKKRGEKQPSAKTRTSSRPIDNDISRDYVMHEPLFRYIKDIKYNFYDYLTRDQKRIIDKKFKVLQEKEEEKEHQKNERVERWCQKNQKKCPQTKEEPKPDLEKDWEPKRTYTMHEPPFRYIDDLKNKYIHLLSKKKKKKFLEKYKAAKAIEDQKRKEKQEKEEQKLKEKSKDEKEKPTEQIEPVTPRTDYDLKAPMFRYIKDTAENFENYLNEKSKEPFMNLYKEMEAVYNEKIQKEEERHVYQRYLEKFPEKPKPEPKVVAQKDIDRNYNLSDPKYESLDETIKNFKPHLPVEYEESRKNLYDRLHQKVQIRAKSREERFKHAFEFKNPDKEEKERPSTSPKEQKPLTEQEEMLEEEARAQRIINLSTPKTRTLECNYDFFKEYMSSEKQEKIRLDIERMKPLSMEQMELQIKNTLCSKKQFRDRVTCRNKHIQEVVIKMQNQLKKEMVLKLLKKCVRRLPKQILYAQYHPLTKNEQKIYDTALKCLCTVMGYPMSYRSQMYNHGIAMQVVKFVDKIFV